MATWNEAVHIRSGAADIDGTFVMPTTRMPGVLLVHGWGGSQSQYLARAKEIAALGCVCLTFDMSGHARTVSLRDTVSRDSNLRDVLAAYDLLAGHHAVDPQSICVVGSSYGGYLAAILTTMRPVRWLALRVPALYKDESWELPKQKLRVDQNLDIYRQTFVASGDNRALRACSEFKGDVLIVESEHDAIIPHAVITSYQESFLRAHSMTARVIKGADHGLSDPEHQKSYGFLLTNWIGEMLRGARDAVASEASAKTAEIQDPGPVAPEQPPAVKP